MTPELDKTEARCVRYVTVTFRQCAKIEVKGSTPGLVVLVGTLMDRATEDNHTAQNDIQDLVKSIELL